MENSESCSPPGKFVWKRDSNYDMLLLTEVNSANPFAFNNQKPHWTAVADSLQKSKLKMRVTSRSCRERVAELLKSHRKNEYKSYRASGISEASMSELKELLTSVATLEAAKPDKQLKALYSRNDKEAAEAIRSSVLQSASNREESVDRDEEEVEMEEEEDRDKNKKRKSDGLDKNFEFGPKKGQPSTSNSTSKNTPLLTYLDKKFEKESSMRKEEFQLRERELLVKEKDAENKSKEIEVARLKAEAEADERKKIMDLLLKLAGPKQ